MVKNTLKLDANRPGQLTGKWFGERIRSLSTRQAAAFWPHCSDSLANAGALAKKEQ